jgi:hypothetical protein
MSKEKSHLSIWRTGGFFVFVDKLADCSTAWIIDLFFEQDKRMLSNQGAGGCCPSTAVESGVSAPWAAQAGKICLDSGSLLVYMNIHIVYCIQVAVLLAG